MPDFAVLPLDPDHNLLRQTHPPYSPDIRFIDCYASSSSLQPFSMNAAVVPVHVVVRHIRVERSVPQPFAASMALSTFQVFTYVSSGPILCQRLAV
jgi:hypothetical protein